jgi:hypothetical protein
MFATTAFTARTAAVSHRRSQNAMVTQSKMSRIGKQTIEVPDKVNVTINGQNVVVKVRCLRCLRCAPVACGE